MRDFTNSEADKMLVILLHDHGYEVRRNVLYNLKIPTRKFRNKGMSVSRCRSIIDAAEWVWCNDMTIGDDFRKRLSEIVKHIYDK